jgi:hypothetical protein
MLAQKLRGYQDIDFAKIYRHFVKGKANITVKNEKLTSRIHGRPTIQYHGLRYRIGYEIQFLGWIL